MTQQDLIDNITNKLDVPAATVEKVLKAYADTVRNLLNQGMREVPLHRKLGKLKVVNQAEREYRNPATGETMTVPAKYRVVFKAAKALKQAVNE